jgi:hypothetical protein
MPLRSLAIALATAVLVATPSSSGQVSVADLVARASTYVAGLIASLSSVVAEEEYLQDSLGFGSAGRLYRQIKSDFLLVRPEENDNVLMAFRDVYEVEGKPVRDRDDRLARLFIARDQDRVGRARAISQESARYNLGRVLRENNPLQVIAFLQDAYRDRFQFALDRRDAGAGPDVWIVTFVETGRPTLLTGPRLPEEGARGRIWLEAATGRPVRTELDTRLITVRTRFGFDERLQTDVPLEMVEAYRQAGGFANVVIARGTATYSRFRRFEVTTQDALP